MLISELIEALQEQQNIHGDIQVGCRDTKDIFGKFDEFEIMKIDTLKLTEGAFCHLVIYEL